MNPPGAHRPGERRKVMHPRMMGWSHSHHCSPSTGCCTPSGYGPWARHYSGGEHGGGEFGGGAFGVRRPLRFLAYRLQLDEEQVAALAVILNELKTERAQTAVDD